MKKVWIVLISLFVSMSAFADTLRLTDGTVVKGSIVSQDSQKVVIDSDLGRMEIPRYKVASMDFGNSATPAAAPATTAAPAAATPNIIINQNVSQNASAGGGEGGGATSEAARKQAVVKLERMVRSKDFLNKKKAKAMSEQAALLPYEYRALLLDKHKASGSFGYGWINFFLPGIGSILQGDIPGVLITYGGIISGYLILATGVQGGSSDLAFVGAFTVMGFEIWNWFRPGMYESDYNKHLREGLAVYYSQLPSLEMPLFTSEDAGIQVPIVSFKF